MAGTEMTKGYLGEDTALKKFQDLDEKLCADPRLRILQE